MDDMNMAEHEADKMSLDGHDDDSMSSHAGPEDMPITDDPDDVTDEEDWARIGPQALRQSSHGAARSGRNHRIDYNHLSYSSARAKPTPSLMKTVPGQQRRVSPHLVPSHRGISYPGGIVPPTSALGFGSSGFSKQGVQDVDSQEREAVEALLRMGSM
jgi:hypothetical protein